MRVRVKTGSLARASEEDPEYCLTELREYFVLGIDDVYVRLADDYGEPILYPKHLFDVLDHSLPPGWRLDEYEDGEYHLDPHLAARPGFYEEYFSSGGDRVTQFSAHAVVRKVLEAARDWGTEADRAVIEAELMRLLERQRRAIERPGYRW